IYKRYRGLEFNHTEQTEYEKEYEATINQLKTVIAKPIHTLEKTLKKSKNVKEYCMAIYTFIEQLKVPDKLEARQMKALADDKLIDAKRNQQAWDAVINLLDQYVEILGEQTINLHDFMKVLDSGLEAMEFTLIPPAIDQVFVADVELSRLAQMRAVFV